MPRLVGGVLYFAGFFDLGDLAVDPPGITPELGPVDLAYGGFLVVLPEEGDREREAGARGYYDSAVVILGSCRGNSLELTELVVDSPEL